MLVGSLGKMTAESLGKMTEDRLAPTWASAMARKSATKSAETLD